MTNPEFLQRYSKILKGDGYVHLKTDSEFLHGYTHGILQALELPVIEAFHDIDLQIYNQDNMLHNVRTHYEGLFRDKGKAITYIKFGVHVQ